MNKLILSAVLACGLLLLYSPAQADHDTGRKQYRSAGHHDYRDGYRRGDRRYDGYRHEYRDRHYQRASRMPHRLKHNRSFRHWYKHSHLRHNRHLSWHVLFDIYRWEHSYRRGHRH